MSENVKVLITVDCGISAVEEISYAKTLGMDVILTDHH
ncbi:MAG: DHH family phosphoesterase [Endomicrobium sp.]|nr:DHH family phosphoesterase [Endomicrobium sp.]